VIFWCSGDINLSEIPHWKPGTIDLAEVYSYWGYWVWLAVMLLGQALLLLVPMDIARERPVSRRKLLVPVVTSAFLFANLVFAGVFCLLFAQYGDQAPDKILFWTNFGMPDGADNPVQKSAGKFLGFTLSDSDRTSLGAISILLLLWAVWGYVFYRFSRSPRSPAAPTLLRRLLNWLLAGSILEFLVAVPSHVLVRSRNDCCAPAGTFWGIACGLSIMLLSFGPGVMFLFAERFKRLKPTPKADPPPPT
jgi:hypothetical protein